MVPLPKFRNPDLAGCINQNTFGLTHDRVIVGVVGDPSALKGLHVA